jgi:hypothetical protein
MKYALDSEELFQKENEYVQTHEDESNCKFKR